MTLKERLQEDWKNALKSKDKFKAETVSMARAAVLLVEKTNGVQLDDDKVIEVLAREIKQRRDAILEFEKGKRQDLVDKTKAEIEILFNYLPQQLSESEISDIVRKAVEEVGASSMKDMKAVMAVVTPKIKGRADGKLVSQLVRDILDK